MADDEGPTLSTHDTLLAYSEWLDEQGIVRSDDEHDRVVRILVGKTIEGPGFRVNIDRPTACVIADVLAFKKFDARTHDDLAREFIEHWESDDTRKPLAGRALASLGRMLQRAFDHRE